MLSAAYYRHRAEVLRFALITTWEPVAARRLRTLVEKYRGLADRADKHIESAQGVVEPRQPSARVPSEGQKNPMALNWLGRGHHSDPTRRRSHDPRVTEW